MENFLENAPCIFLTYTEHGRITGVNQTLCNLCGLDRRLLLQKNISGIVTLGSRIFLQTHFFPLLQLKGAAEEIFITLLAANGTEVPVIINTKTSVVPEEYISIGITIYNRNKYEAEIIAAKKYAEKALLENKELQQAKQQLQHHASELDTQLIKLQQQNENLSQLNWTLTHTMQEPLRKIALFSSALLQNAVGDKVDWWLKKINHLSIETREIFVQLQQYLQMGIHHQEAGVINLQALITEVAAPYAAEEHTISINLQASLDVKGFTKYLRQLFQHIFKNAVQYRLPGQSAHISIESTIIKANAFRMLKEKYQYSDYLRISIADKGTGFLPEHNEQVFALFNRLSNTSTGFGMGLALSRRIMELHNGFITADGEPGKGAVINCFFPIETTVDREPQEVNEVINS